MLTHSYWLTDDVVDVCSQEVSSNGIFGGAGWLLQKDYLYFFSKTYRKQCDIVLLVRCSHIILKGFVMKVFEIKLCIDGSERVIILILPMLFNCWFVRDWLPLQRVNQLFETFILKELESDQEGKRHDLRMGRSHLWYLQIFPSNGGNPSCRVGYAFASEWGKSH